MMDTLLLSNTPVMPTFSSQLLFPSPLTKLQFQPQSQLLPQLPPQLLPQLPLQLLPQLLPQLTKLYLLSLELFPHLSMSQSIKFKISYRFFIHPSFNTEPFL
jgi:hypothetical protein